MSSQAVTWRELLAETAARLGAAAVSAPEFDARHLVQRAAGLEWPQLVTSLDLPATRRGVAHLEAMVERRSSGEPLQYVLGCWGFRSLDLLVDGRVLIPRPETEQVVEVALRELRRLAPDRPATAVDLGTGSGAIALSLAVEVLTARVWGVDRSADALSVARANLAAIGRPAARVRLAEGHWFAALPGELAGSIDLVVANPPYVAEGEALPAAVADWEPLEAIRAGPAGTEHLERIVAEAPGWLARPGVLVMELAPHQATSVAALAGTAGFTEVEVHPDLAGRPRALVARR